MSSDCDIAVVGAGHNSLTAAAYLATAGKRVVVLERNPYAGGGAATAELTEPGFLSERHGLLHVLIVANPLIANDELGLLSRYGLEYIPLDKPYGAIFDDGTYVPIYRDRAKTMEKIAEFSPRDAEAYDRFMDIAVAIVEMMMAGFFVPPVPLETMLQMLQQHPAGRELLTVTSRSVLDVFNEWFESEKLRLALIRMASEILVTHPADRDTGAFAYASIGFLERFGMSMARGGSGQLSQALVRCIEDHGGEVRTSVEVQNVILEGRRAIGVRLIGGEEIRADDAVVGSIHPHHLEHFVEGLDPELVRAARRVELSPFTGFVVHCSLEEPLEFRAGPEAGAIVMNTLSSPSMDALLAAYDSLRRGRLPDKPLLGGGCVTNVDPSRAPDGKAVLHIFSQVTYDLADGGPARWQTIGESYADTVMHRVGDFVTNLDGNVRARHVTTPLQHEIDTPSFYRGDINGVAMYANQLGAGRPIPALSQYAVPGIERLYLAGPFMHPGGGLIGGGRPTAMRIFSDLGLDFDAVASAGVGAQPV